MLQLGLQQLDLICCTLSFESVLLLAVALLNLRSRLDPADLIKLPGLLFQIDFRQFLGFPGAVHFRLCISELAKLVDSLGYLCFELVFRSPDVSQRGRELSRAGLRLVKRLFLRLDAREEITAGILRGSRVQLRVPIVQRLLGRAESHDRNRQSGDNRVYHQPGGHPGDWKLSAQLARQLPQLARLEAEELEFPRVLASGIPRFLRRRFRQIQRLRLRFLFRRQLTELELVGFQRLIRLLGRRDQGTRIPRYLDWELAFTHSKPPPLQKTPQPLSTSRTTTRSEERRVGKECRSRWSP